jgi:hypothetical protein
MAQSWQEEYEQFTIKFVTLMTQAARWGFVRVDMPTTIELYRVWRRELDHAIHLWEEICRAGFRPGADQEGNSHPAQ